MQCNLSSEQHHVIVPLCVSVYKNPYNVYWLILTNYPHITRLYIHTQTTPVFLAKFPTWRCSTLLHPLCQLP